MNAVRPARVAVVLVLTSAALACSDTPTGPPLSGEAPASSLLWGGGSATVRVVERDAPLVEEISVTRTVGLLGGTVAVPEAGLLVVIPPGAVLRATPITVTAPAGSLVGYRFSPHGRSFRVPLVVLQDLSGTNAGLLQGELVAAYFEGPLAPLVEALELLPLDLFGSLGLFHVTHFSGYVVATN